VKIGIIVRLISPGGVPKMAIEETRNLALLGCKSELIYYREGSARAYKYKELLREIKTKSFDKGLLKYMNRLFGYISLIFLPSGRALESTVDILSIILAPILFPKKSYDVLLCMDQLAGITGLVASKRGIKYFVYVHEPIFISSLLGSYRISRFRITRKLVTALLYNVEKKILMNATGVFFNSQGTYRWMAKYFPFLRNKGKVVYPGCHPIDKLPEKRDAFILSVSRWDSNKYPTFMLDLAKKIPAKFVIAGSWTPPNLLNDFINNIHKNKLNEKVEVLTNVSEKDMRYLFLKARVFVHWSVEGFSMGVLEAMAHGLPEVTRRGAGVGEIITNGFNGFVIEEAERDKFISLPLDAPQRKPSLDRYLKTLENLLGNQELCEVAGRNAWETSKKYDWTEHAKQLSSFIRSMSGTKIGKDVMIQSS